MTSQIQIPKPFKEENKMSVMKSLVGKKITKNVKFMGKEIEIAKLTVREVQDIQVQAKALEGADGNDGIEVLMLVIKSAVPDAADMTEEDFKGLPMDELSTLSTAIMTFSGFGGAGK